MGSGLTFQHSSNSAARKMAATAAQRGAQIAATFGVEEDLRPNCGVICENVGLLDLTPFADIAVQAGRLVSRPYGSGSLASVMRT